MAGATAKLLCPAVITGTTINISTFVADPNNAGTGIQNALNALGTSGNNVLSFGVGVTYTVNSFPTIANKTGWKIIGNGATIKAANGLAVSFQNHQLKVTTCTDCVIDTLYFDGNRANRTPAEQEGQCVGLYDCDRISFLSCKFINSPGSDGIQLSGIATNEPNPALFCTDILLFNCIADNNYRGGCFIRNVYNCQIRGGSYSNSNGTSPRFGVGIEPNSGSGGGADAVRDVLIEGVTFTDNEGIHSYAGGVVPIRRVTWKGNRFNDAGNGPSDGQGSCLRGTAIDVLVQGNTFESVITTSRSAINVQSGGPSVPSDWIVDGNSFNSCDFVTSVIYFFDGSGHVASNNKFFNCPDAHVAGSVGFGDINNTTVGVRSDPSPVPPTTADLNFCSTGSGARKFEYIEQMTRQSITNNTTPTTVLRLTHTPPSNSTFWYFAVGSMDNTTEDNPLLSGRVRLQQRIAEATLGSVEVSSGDVTDRIQLMWGAEYSYGIGPNPQDIDIQISSEGNSTVGLDDIRILGVQKISADRFASHDAVVSNAVDGSQIVVTMSEVLTGDYLFLCFAEVQGLPDSGVIIQADMDGTKFGYLGLRMPLDGTNEWRTWGTAFTATGLAGLQTIFVEIANPGIAVRKTRIFALNLSYFARSYHVADRVRSFTTAATVQTRSTLTQTTIAAEHVIFGGFMLDGASITQSVLGLLDEDGTSISNYSEEPFVAASLPRNTPFFTFAKHQLTGASHIWRTRYNSEVAGTQTGIAESFISVIDLTPRTLNINIDALLQSGGLLAGTMDAVLQGQVSKTTVIGAVLTGTMTKTVSLDAILQGTSSTLLQTQISAILKGPVTKQASMDAALRGTIPLTVSIDAIFQKEIAATASMDAVLAGNLVSLTLVSFMSAKLLKQFSATAQIDSILAIGGLALTTRLDAILSAEWLPESSGEDIWTTPGSPEDGWIPATPVESPGW